MLAPIDVQHLPETRPPLTSPTVATTRLVLHHQSRTLERLLHKRVRHPHPVLAARRLVEVPHIPSAVSLPVQSQNPFHLPYGHTPRRWRSAPMIEQAFVAPLLQPRSIPSHRPCAEPQNLRRLKPVNLPRQCPQNHVLDPHRPLPRSFRVPHPLLHGALPWGLFATSKRSDHLLSGADRSSAPYTRRGRP